MMFSCKAFFPGLLLAALALPAQSEGLDLSYPEPALAAPSARSQAQEPATPRLKLQFKPAISYDHTCSGQCTYETNIDQLHDRETRQSSSIGFD
ncbi:hypothetical protein [Pseudomonas sp. L5B5]|uniref:hypothetical protein n=1 Tax=Pseudomonas sp. L5B5 TaxID=2883205 RepID=UPI001CF99BBD|nr:hypothetical protein [Pseudomonas sp. L5B5]UCZ84740.1 hypothetical protein LGQ10_31300 [Pseudomonas sp. L5B5]